MFKNVTKYPIGQKRKTSYPLQPLEVNNSMVFCCLFTLRPTEPLFSHLTLKNTIYHNRQGKDYMLLSDNSVHELYTTLNKPSLRQLAYSLITPALQNDFSLLIQYVKKFKNNYKLYFLCKSKDYANFPSEREINTVAIKTLQGLIGI